MKITECRVVIINEKGLVTSFPYTIGKQHQECIGEYAKKCNYEYSNIDYVVRKNNIVFSCDKTDMVICYMPKTLSDEQLEILDRLSLKMDDIAYMEVRKYKKDGYQDFILGSSIGRRFSDEVIQSYFIKEVSKSI